MYGCSKPTGIASRLYTLDPTGNCEKAEAARAALTLYGARLMASSFTSYREEGARIIAWIDSERAYAENMKVMSDVNG